MSIARLGHVGIHANDLGRQVAFYRDVLGLVVTDRDDERGMVFLSARPDEEHHEVLLCGGRSAPANARVLQQVAFRCNALEDILEFRERFARHDVTCEMLVTHGNAVSIYFFDPEGNRCEVYWNTGLKARQPFLERIDLSQSAAAIVADVRRSVAAHGETGYVNDAVLAGRAVFETA